MSEQDAEKLLGDPERVNRMGFQIHLTVCPRGQRTKSYYLMVKVMPRIGECIVLRPETDEEERYYVTDIDYPVSLYTDDSGEEKPVGWQRGRPEVVARWEPRPAPQPRKGDGG